MAILPLPRRKSDSAARPKLSKFRAVSKNNSFRPDTNYVSGAGSSFDTVCTDVSGTLYLGGTYSYNAPSAFAGNNGLAPTWGAGNEGVPPGPVNTANAAAGIQAASFIFYNNQSILTESAPKFGISGETVTDDKAALQLAVWAALYDASAGQSALISLNASGNRFSVTGTSSETWSGSWGSTSAGTPDALTAAQDMLNSLYAQDQNLKNQYSGSLLVPNPLLQNGGYSTAAITPQEVFINVTPVPEPTTLIAGGLLLLPFAASALRSRSKRITAAKRS